MLPRHVLVLTAAVMVATMTCVASAGACGGTHRANARPKLTSVGLRAPLIIGDSTMIYATPKLGARGLEADARGCRQFGQGVAMLAARRRAGTLPQLAILALGANGAAGRGAIERALRVVGRRRVLGLVTPRNSGSTRRAMRAAARRHPERVVVIDWRVHSDGHGGWFSGDGLHVTQTGARAFAEYVRRRIAVLAAPPVRRLRLPTRVARAKACGTARRADLPRRVYVVRGQARVTCARARELARHPPLQPLPGWQPFVWTRTGNGPWSEVYVRRGGGVIVATVGSPARLRAA